MTSDDHTIDLTSGGRPLPSSNGNGSVATNGNGHAPGSNGNGSSRGVLVVDDQVTARGGELDGIEWFPSYDRESVEQHLRDLDQERLRLEDQIAEAERRTAAAEEALAARTAELEAGLGAVVLAARSELARIDRERDEAIAAIEAEAEAEAARIREAARHEAETVRGAASSLSAAVTSGDQGIVTPPTAPGPSAVDLAHEERTGDAG